MRKHVLFLLVLFTSLSILSGCSVKTGSPPIPKVIAEKTQIPVTQGSYCWGGTCADYSGGKALLKGKVPTVVAPESFIKVSYDYKPAPTDLLVQQIQENKTINIPIQNGYFQAPKEKGVYYYGLSATWLSSDGKYSNGDTSSAFVIEVK